MTTATTVRTPCRNRELTPEQCAALDQLIMGKSDRETAEAIGVHRVTVTRCACTINCSGHNSSGSSWKS